MKMAIYSMTSRWSTISSSLLFKIPSICVLPAPLAIGMPECRKVIVDTDSAESCLHIFTIIISIMVSSFLWLAASAFPKREWTKTAA